MIWQIVCDKIRPDKTRQCSATDYIQCFHNTHLFIYVLIYLYIYRFVCLCLHALLVGRPWRALRHPWWCLYGSGHFSPSSTPCLVAASADRWKHVKTTHEILKCMQMMHALGLLAPPCPQKKQRSGERRRRRWDQLVDPGALLGRKTLKNRSKRRWVILCIKQPLLF